VSAPGRSWTTSGLGAEAFTDLAERLPASAVWSLLLDVMARRAARRTPASLLRQWTGDDYVRPTRVGQRTLVELDGHLLASAEGFEALELSPVAPLGACSVPGLTSQNRVLSALRGTELVADPTNLLALECAARLRQDARRVIRLATSHRCVRAQAFPRRPGFSRHFRIFCLATAGREIRDHGFSVDAMVEQIHTHLGALERLEGHGYAFPARRVTVLATDARASVGERVAQAVRGAPVARGPLAHAYYDGGVRFLITARSVAGDDVPFIDGGVFTWLEALASNRRLSLVASGMGAELAIHLFRPRGISPSDRGAS
jgi:hypothetical protein